jgi:hypothetical protein
VRYEEELDRLRRAYAHLVALKEKSGPSPPCVRCAQTWSLGSSYLCLDCGATYGRCCVKELPELEEPWDLSRDGIYTVLRYRCRCGGMVG